MSESKGNEAIQPSEIKIQSLKNQLFDVVGYLEGTTDLVCSKISVITGAVPPTEPIKEDNVEGVYGEIDDLISRIKFAGQRITNEINRL